jgi:hypothetical protein
MKFRQSIFLLTALAMIATLVACGGSSHSTTTTTPVVSIAATSGTPQSATVGTAFAAPLVATVTTNGSPASGVTVTFTAPSSGASGSFAGGVNTATTNSSGVATSPVFTANSTAGTYSVTASASGAATPASFSLTNAAAQGVSIGATSGTPQSALVGTAFAAKLVATVMTGGTPTSGVTVTFTAPSSGASGTFTNGTATETDTANASGVATSSTFTANSTSGAYTVSASAPGASAPASFSLTNTAVSVSLSPFPTSLQGSSGTAFTAFVANDSSNAGVNWTVTCGSAGACGTLSASSSGSGVATDFSAPVAVPTNNTVTITATSVTHPTKSASATVTITAANTLGAGNYVFSLAGEDSSTSGGPYFVAGQFTVNSSGAITGGEQDFIDLGLIATDAITGGSVTTTGQGKLLITLDTADSSVGVGGVETLDAALFSATRARIIEFDSSATSSGRVDLQTTPIPVPSNGYAFYVAGLDSASPANVQTIGGVINIDGSGTISGNGSVFDINDGGTVAQAQSFAASTVSPADSFGRIVLSLVPSATSGVAATNLVGYIVDPTHIRLVETGDSLNGTMGGVAIGQGANTGTFTSITGNSYVAGLTGFDTTGVLQVAGVLTANSDGSTLSGAINYNDLTGTGPEAPSAVTGGTYTVDPTGRVTMSNVTDGTVTFNLQLYLTGLGSEAEVTAASMDTDDALAGLGFAQTGGGSFTASSFFGNYVLSATGADVTSEDELDAAGPVVADGIGAFNGTVDLNWIFTGTSTGLPVSPGSFTASANGAFSGAIQGLDVTTATNNDVFVYYLVDTTKIFAIETDTNQLTLGFFTLEQ